MRILVFLLVLANLLFYAFSQGYLGQAENPDAQRVTQQISPERVKIVAQDEPLAAVPVLGEAPPPTPESPAEPTPAPESPKLACTRWESLPLVDADRLTALLADKFPAFKLSRRLETGEGGGWWVYIPPLPNKSAADKKAGELRALGITDYFVLQEADSRQFAISLGIFSSKKGAQERFAQLNELGIRSARLSQRPSKDGLVTVDAHGALDERAELRSAASSLLPSSKAQDCP